MSKAKKRYRLALLITGVMIIVLSWVAVLTSRLTPWLIRYPLVLDLIGYSGLSLTLLVATLSGIGYIHLHRRVYLVLCVCALSAAAFIHLTLLGSAFQLPVAGWILGGSLILLGCSTHRFTRNFSI